MKIKYPKSTQLFMKILGIVLVLVGLFLFKLSWKLEYVQIIPLFLGCLLPLIGVFLFNEGFRTITVDAEGIKEKRLIREIKLTKKEVEGYTEVIYSNPKRDITQFVIFSNNEKGPIKVHKANWGEDYERLLERVKADYKKIEQEDVNLIGQQKKVYKNIGKGIGVFIFIFGLYQLVFTSISPPKNIHELHGIIAEKPIIRKKTKKRKKTTISFQLNKYPEFKFKVKSELFSRFNSDLKNIKINDEVSFKILKSEFQQKLLRSVPPDFKRKYINWDIIELYSVEHKGEILLDTKEVKRTKNSPLSKILIMMCGIGVFLYYQYGSKGHD